MEALALHTGAPTVHWEYNTSCICVESKTVTPIVKNIGITVCFLIENFYNGFLLVFPFSVNSLPFTAHLGLPLNFCSSSFNPYYPAVRYFTVWP